MSILVVIRRYFPSDDESFLPLCYSPNVTIAAYSMGVATHVVVETAEGGGESEKGKEEVEEIGSIVVESLLLMDHSSDTQTPFKVLAYNPLLRDINAQPLIKGMCSLLRAVVLKFVCVGSVVQFGAAGFPFLCQCFCAGCSAGDPSCTWWSVSLSSVSVVTKSQLVSVVLL